MSSELKIYNTLSRVTEKFTPLHNGHVGMYVCGPTVYSNAHLGNARTFISFDVIFRYFLHLGYKVRYVRNITDAGHLESDADEGEDKISKKAKLEQLEPMEIVQRYTIDFHNVMSAFNALPPSIEPTATGHIMEQIEMTKKIIANGYAYESNGSVYFDVAKFAAEYNYTVLTGRNLDDLLNNTRELDGQEEKKGRLDFALWIKAKPEHIMRWPSPWGEGFPGWHLECSAMSSKYLGEKFDIHGGGMDLAPTHHTNEIAQNIACNHSSPANYWMHTNMLTVNGQKMSKSLGNSFLPFELFAGTHQLLEKGYSPMAVRFFMLQAHYRSTLDFSNEALQAAEKGFARLMNAVKLIAGLKTSAQSTSDITQLSANVYAAMNDDFNTPIALSHLFEGVRIINSVNDGKETITEEDKATLQKLMFDFVFDILGLKEEQAANSDKVDGLMQMILQQRVDAKARKDYAASDLIRDRLKELGFEIKDGKEGTTYTFSG
ncbi:MAG: cysteine--tRNA ligase [Bacteroidia bacterium]|nr:cysteine--tRNA ligase [Bacteroidia bacterium]MBP7260151.1 cysteine--tRNA ligase [Bacteroidia bacterium]MBP9179460.1 cysteine--tRNA ligase [Bacteroidia bacterium]MBP9723778.1 cysteine--tRNA ligase [Bacteroidia bacterium]